VHLRLDLGVAGLDLLAAAGEPQRVLEARREAGREELLRVRSLAVATDLLRRPDPDVQLAVAGPGPAVDPPALDVGLRGVQDLAHRNHLDIARAMTTRWISFVPS
jgi:hypothetical protein